MANPKTARGAKMIAVVDCRDVAACAGLRLRRAARMTTQMFDAHLAPAQLTIGQFGILTQLFAVGQPLLDPGDNLGLE